MFLHAKDAAEKGHRRIMLRTVDTDAVVLAVSTVVSKENTQLWIAFGTGKHLRYTAFATWRSFNAVTEVFARLVTRPISLDNVCMSVLELYMVLMYDRGSDETTVDSARKHMFT